MKDESIRPSSFRGDTLMLDDLPREEVIAVVDRVAAELLAAAAITAPPVDAIALAQKHLGMVVCLDRKQQQRGRAQRAAGLRQIYLRPEPSEERHQWTVAHEIGEHLKAGMLARLGVRPHETPALAGESLANLFAHRLLVPTPWFAEDAPACDYDVLELKRRYRTASHEVIAWRLLDLPEPCIVTIVDNDRIAKRRSNANAWRVKAKQMEAPEQQCQRHVHRSGEPRVVRQGSWTVQGWPVHRADWKREILRSVRDGDC
jgi:Zn-dependent peptidase ImmA (M78 family)